MPDPVVSGTTCGLAHFVATRFCRFGGHWAKWRVSEFGRPSWLSPCPRPFQVARQRRTVADWNVSSEPALRHFQGADEGDDASGGALRELSARPPRRPSRTRSHHGRPAVAAPLFRRGVPSLRSVRGAIVLQLIGRPGDVDDVVQDVFIQAHRGMSKLRDPEAVRPWLRRIAVRRARRWLRKRWVRRWFGESDVDVEAELVDASASPEERAQIAHIYRTLERMPRDERIVWVLRLVEGETLESIAELLGCSVSTVQRRLRAAQATMGEMR